MVAAISEISYALDKFDGVKQATTADAPNTNNWLGDPRHSSNGCEKGENHKNNRIETQQSPEKGKVAKST